MCGVRYEIGFDFTGYGVKNKSSVLGQPITLNDAVEEVLNNITVNYKFFDLFRRDTMTLLNCPKYISSLYRNATSSEEDSQRDLSDVKYGNLCLVFEKHRKNRQLEKIKYDEVIRLENRVVLQM